MLKYIHIGLLFIFVSAFCGCNLDTDDEDKMPGDKFWDGSAANAEAFMLSVYQNLRTATTDNGFFLYAGDIRCAPITGLKTNNYLYLVQNNMKGYKGVKDSQDEGSSSDFGAIYNWRNMYKVVQSANIMIEEVSNVKELSSGEIERYRAESRFLRSLAYFFMVRIFGDVPYYTEAYYSAPLPRTDKQVVLKNCLADLQSLLDSDPDKSILPWRNGNGSLRANRGAVLTLMMHMNMWLAFFDETNAVAYYDEVKRLAETDSWIDSDVYSLQPMDQITEVFKGESNEGLFEIAQNVTMGEIFKTDHMWCTRVVYQVRNKTNPDFTYSEVFLKQLYPKEIEDKRKDRWFNNLYNVDDEHVSIIRPIEIVKLLNADSYGKNTIPNAGNYIVFRLADAVLLYAEALNNLGEDDKALEEVNRIRQRAGAPDFTTEDDLDASIYWERVRELMGEGQYFYDLVRTQKICDTDFATFSDESGHREKKADLKQGSWTWPIYKKALDNNPYMTKNLYWE